MNKIFLQALAWNSITIFIYKISLLLHQIALYSAINKNIYGAQSCIFAGIYFGIAVSNFGFDETLIPFFSHFVSSKQAFWQLIYKCLLRVFCLITVTTIAYWCIHNQLELFLHNQQIDCNKNISIVIATLFIIENIKKTLSFIIKLLLANKEVALAEITSLWLYLTIVWGLYSSYKSLSLPTIFSPLIVASLVEIVYFIVIIHRFYQALPVIRPQQERYLPIATIAHQQGHNYINQATKALYSPNSIILIFSWSLGFAQVATIKFFINIITLIYTCLSKTFGMATSITLSGFSSHQVAQSKIVLRTIQLRYLQFLTIVSSSIFITVLYAWAIGHINAIMTLQILLFFIIGFLEQASLIYEQFFIAQGAMKLLTFINIINLALITCSYLYIQQSLASCILIMFILIASKTISLIMIRQIAYAHWQV